MKAVIYIPAGDLEELRFAVDARLCQVITYEREAIGYPGEATWRQKREALERIIDALREAS